MNQLAAVREFMQRAGQHVPLYLTEPDIETRRLRVRLIAEEMIELAAASSVSLTVQQTRHDGTVERLRSDDHKWPTSVYQSQIDAADALADLLYVVLGTAIAWGINLDAVFEEVHRSNMTKFIDGYRRDDGKWVKGPSYTPADIRAALLR